MYLADRRLATRTETRKRPVARKTEKHLAHVPPPLFSPRVSLPGIKSISDSDCCSLFIKFYNNESVSKSGKYTNTSK